MRGEGYVGWGKRRGEENWSFEEGDKKRNEGTRGEMGKEHRGEERRGKRKGEEMGAEERHGKGRVVRRIKRGRKE